MFRRRFFLFLCAARLSLAAKNVTIVPPSNALKFSTGWTQAVNAAGQLYLLQDGLGTVLSVSLPASASQFYYVGLQRTGGSAYGFCLDCDAQGDMSALQIADGQDPALTDDSQATPIVLFSSPMDPSSQHELVLLNLPDDRFGGDGQVTFAGLLVTVEGGDEGAATSSQVPPSTTVLPPLSTSSTGSPSTAGTVSLTIDSSTPISSTPPITSTSPTTSISPPITSTSPLTDSTSGHTEPTESVSLPTDSASLATDSTYLPPDSTSTFTTATSSPSTNPTASRSSTLSPSSSLSQSLSATASSSTSTSTSHPSASAANVPIPTFNSTLIAVIVVLSAIGVLSLLLGLFIFFRKRNRRMQKRKSEALSFKDRPLTEGYGQPLAMHQYLYGTGAGASSRNGPLTVAGRVPPPETDFNWSVGDHHRPPPPVPGTLPLGLNPNRYMGDSHA